MGGSSELKYAPPPSLSCSDGDQEETTVVSFAGRIYGKRGAKNIVETIKREVEAHG